MISGLRARTALSVGAGSVLASTGAALLSVEYAWLALVAVGTVCIALVSVTFAPLLAIVTVPAMWFGGRLPFFGGIISISDCVMYLGALTAILMIDWRRTRIGAVAVPIAVFTASGFLTMLAAGTTFGFVEWGHRVAMIVGALVIGVLLRQSGRLELAIRLFIGVSILFGLEAVRERVLSPNLPAYPFGIQKNYAGGLLGIAELILLFWPAGLRLRRSIRWPFVAFIPLTMLATGSRGAIGSAIAITAAILGMRARDSRLRALLLAGSLAFIGYTLYNGYQLGNEEAAAGLTHNPDAVRLHQLAGALTLWRESPLLGSGFLAYHAHIGFFDPHDVIALTLEETGLLGVAALAFLLIGTAVQVGRHGNELTVIALALLGDRFVHGLVDVYWVHGTGPMPWFVIGAALAERAVRPAVSSAISSAGRRTALPSALPFSPPGKS